MAQRIAELDVKSHKMLITIVDLMFDKALRDKQFQGVMASVICSLKEQSQEWVKGYVKPYYCSEEQAEGNRVMVEQNVSAIS